jgi:hypothetical protein
LKAQHAPDFYTAAVVTTADNIKAKIETKLKIRIIEKVYSRKQMLSFRHRML